MCGIFGTVNKVKPKRFRYTPFASLGIFNDSRGGDSCGIFIDKKYEYGVDKKKLFRNFMVESKVLEEFRGKEVSVAIGHCRKASIGAVNEANAQPVILKDANGEPEFVLIHNGTIKNHEDLAKKYIPEVDIKDMTDSQVMARIFHKAGYQVLSEYYGGGVFFVVDYRKGHPECFFFQGYSKQSEYSKEVTQERPLFFVNRDGTLSFSSIYEILQIACPGAEIWQPAPNTLYSFTDKGLIAEKEYSRANVAQTMPYSAKSTTTAGTTYWGGANSGVHRGTTSITDNIKARQKEAENAGKTTSFTGGTGTGTTKTTSYTPLSSGGGTTQFHQSSGSTSSTVKYPQMPKDQNPMVRDIVGKRVKFDFDKCRYMVDGKTLHGVYAISDYGIILADDQHVSSKFYMTWFFDGIPMNLVKGQYFYARFKALCVDLKMSPSKFLGNFENLLRWYSADRIYRDDVTKVLLVATGPRPTEFKPFTGVFMRMDEIYGSQFENGIEIEHSLVARGGANPSFFDNTDQGANRITTEQNIAKTLKRICQESLKI